jgi:hypothetical protein
MYRLRMIRREGPDPEDERERTWAVLLGTLLVVMLTQRPDEARAPSIELLIGWVNTIAAAQITREDHEPPAFLPRPVLNDVHGQPPRVRIPDVDPDWPVLFRLFGQLGRRLCPEGAVVFELMDEQAEAIVGGIRRLDRIDTSAEVRREQVLVGDVEQLLLRHLLRPTEEPPASLVRLAGGGVAIDQVLRLAEAKTPAQARAGLRSVLDQLAQLLAEHAP